MPGEENNWGSACFPSGRGAPEVIRLSEIESESDSLNQVNTRNLKFGPGRVAERDCVQGTAAANKSLQTQLRGWLPRPGHGPTATHCETVTWQFNRLLFVALARVAPSGCEGSGCLGAVQVTVVLIIPCLDSEGEFRTTLNPPGPRTGSHGPLGARPCVGCAARR